MSDAQLDGGNVGGKTENAVKNLFGDISDETAVFWYGVFSMSYGALFMVLYLTMSHLPGVYLYYRGYLARMVLYLPVGMAWIMVALFDKPLMRQLFSKLTWVSVFGPFAIQWLAFGWYVSTGDGFFNTVGYWMGFLLYFCLTVAE